MRFTPAVFQHAETVLADLLQTPFPADQVVARYFRQHRALGHGERGFVAENVYAVLRHRRTLEARCAGGVSPRRLLLAALACVHGLNRRELEPLLNEADGRWLGEAKALRVDELAPAVRLELPDWLYERLLGQYGAEQTTALAQALCRPAPLDLRVNPLKATRDDLLARLAADGIVAAPGSLSPLAVRLAGKPSLARHPLFLDGSFEVQDEGSQLLAYLVQPKRGEMVVDFCAGAGGKTLLLGALMRSQGRLYAFDVVAKRLDKLQPRVARAGLSNVHVARIDSERDAKLKRLAGKIDRVLVDAPCSGLGTVRRNPDLKWRQTPESVAELSAKQGAILDAAAALVKRGGRLVYATCSLLGAENEAVVEAFRAAHPDFRVRPASEILAAQGIDVGPADAASPDCLRLLPQRHGTDGFFACALERA